MACRHPKQAWVRVAYIFERTWADFLYLFGLHKYPENIYFLAGLALGGTTWMKNLLGRIPGVYTRPAPMPWDVAYRQNICDSAFMFTPKKYGNTLFKTHLNPTQENIECLKRNGVNKVLITYRDLRDVTLSHYHRLIQFPKPKHAFDYKDYQSMEKEEAINELIKDTAQHMVPWVRGWLKEVSQNPQMYHITRFEDLKADTVGEFKKVLAFYEIDLSSDKILEIVNEAKGRGNIQKNINSSHVLPWAISSNFRKGKVGGWREEFTDENIIVCREYLGEALIEFGYEQNFDWATISENNTSDK